MNRVIYILDASGSMSHRVKQTCELTKASIAKLKPDDLVSLVTFEERTVHKVFDKVKAEDVVFSPKDYKIGGGTNLLDAVHDGCNLLLNASKNDNDTFVVIVLTDGGENTSKKISASGLKTFLHDLQKTDHWTQAWLVPPECVEETKRLGIDPSNIFGWTDINAAASALSGGMDNLAAARAAGKTSLKTGFFADLSGAKKAEIRLEMTDVSAKVRRAKVTKKETIKGFCQREFGEFQTGCALYELTETETVQDYKEVALIDKRRPHEIFLGGRSILGLPDGEVRLKPGNLGHYRAFIGSTSVNRNTDPGTEILYGDGIGKVNSNLVKA